jgi:hypothetical protein
VQQLQAGDTVGYGSSFTADGPLRIGIVACGYADGYPRHCSTGTPVLVDGVRTRMVGRVSMDMITVDLTPVPGAGMGSEVTCGAGSANGRRAADRRGGAAPAPRCGYELMCAVAPRVPFAVELISWVLPAVVVVIFWLTRQATPGKMAIAARIVDAKTGGKPSTSQLLIRYVGYFVSSIPFGLGLFWVAFDARKQGWHDKMAGTVVVRKKSGTTRPVEFET